MVYKVKPLRYARALNYVQVQKCVGIVNLIMPRGITVFGGTLLISSKGSDGTEQAMEQIEANEFNAPIYSLIEMAEQMAADMREMAANTDYIAACGYLIKAEAYEAKAKQYRSWIVRG